MLDLRRGANGPLLTPFGRVAVEFVLWLAAFGLLASLLLNHRS